MLDSVYRFLNKIIFLTRPSILPRLFESWLARELSYNILVFMSAVTPQLKHETVKIILNEVIMKND